MPSQNSTDRFIDSKVVVLFQSLTEKEVKLFSKYIKGTNFQKGNSIFKLLFYLKKYAPDFNEKYINKTAICKYLKKNNGFNENKFLQLCTSLTKVLEDFLIKLQLEKSQTERDFLLLNALKDRKLGNLFFKKVKRVRKTWEMEQPPGIEHLHNEYLLESIYISFSENHNITEIVSAIKKLIDNLDKYYFATRLHNASNMKFTSLFIKNVKRPEDDLQINDILIKSNNGKFCDVPQIKFLRKLHLTLSERNFENFQELLVEFYDNYELYSKDEQIDLLNFFMASCHLNNKKSGKENTNDLIAITKWAVKKEIYISNGFFDANQFTNVVNVASRDNQFGWARNFIDKYSSYLNKKNRTDIVTACRVTCLHAEKKYEELLSLMALVNFNNILISVNARCMQIIAYVELGDKDDLFYNSTKSFKALISRNNLLTKERKEAIKLFIKYSKKLYKMNRSSNFNYGKIKCKVLENEQIVAKKWILKKLDFYEKKRGAN